MSIKIYIGYTSISGFSFVPPDSQFLITEIEEDSLGEGQDAVVENNSDEMLVSLPGTDVVLDWQTVGANLSTNQFLFDELPVISAAPPQEFGDIGRFGFVSPDTPDIEREFENFDELSDVLSLSFLLAEVDTIHAGFTDPDVTGTVIDEEALAILDALVSIVTWDTNNIEHYPCLSQTITKDLGVDPEWKALFDQQKAFFDQIIEIPIRQKRKQAIFRRFSVEKIKKFAGWILYNTLPTSYKEEAMYQFIEDSKLSNHSFFKDLMSYFIGGIEYRFKKIVRGFVSIVIKILKFSSDFFRNKLCEPFLFSIIAINRLISNYPYFKLNE